MPGTYSSSACPVSSEIIVAVVDAIRSHPAATQGRYDDLAAYMQKNVLAPHGFCCASESSCRGSLKPALEFSPGQLSFLGRHYDLAVEGVPLRILVLGMDTGRTDASVGLDQRRQQIYDRIPETFNKRNSHMRGTTLALRVLLGCESWDTPADEYLALDGARVHVLDAYAMANLRLCSATKPPSTNSRATTMMSRNCLRHLRTTIELLEPTIVVTQSVAIRTRIASLIRQQETVTSHLEVVELAGVRGVLLAAFSHPTAREPNAWSSPRRRYFREVVRHTLQEARSLALRGL
jgi:hypothetical protein